MMQLLCCYIGTGFLILSVILCVFSKDSKIWFFIMLIGEIIAFFGYAPVFLNLKFFG